MAFGHGVSVVSGFNYHPEITANGGHQRQCRRGQVVDVRKNPVDRRRFILARATGVGHIGISELADQLNVSMETVRRDLAIMESNGLMRRTYGGAYPVRPETEAAQADSFERRAESTRIAAAGLLEVAGARTLYLDEGFIHKELASALTAHRLADTDHTPEPLTVITPSLSAATVLAAAPRVEVVMLGGRVQPEILAVADDSTLRSLAHHDVDLALMGSSGISIRQGATAADRMMSSVKSHLMSVSRARGLLATQQTFTDPTGYTFAEIGDFDFIIAGSSLLAHEAKQYSALGPRVIRV